MARSKAPGSRRTVSSAARPVFERSKDKLLQLSVHDPIPELVDALEQDGLLRHRAHLLAHDAVTLIGPRDAPILIDVGDTDDGEALLLQLQRRNRADRADLAARGTRVVAIPQAWHEHGSPQAFQSGLRYGRMDGAGRARAGALAAAQALAD